MTTPYERLVDLGNSMGPGGHPTRELLVGAAYDLVCLANVGHLLPPMTRRIAPIHDAIQRWAVLHKEEPLLGLATTRQIMEELVARGVLGQALIDDQTEETLNYRTVDS